MRAAAFAALLAAVFQSGTAPPPGLEILEVRPSFYVIAGEKAGNIAVQVGEDGLVVVDSGSTDDAARVLAAIKSLSPKPIRMFHGAADNYVPVAPCRGYVARLKAKGANVTLTEYPGAHHAFDRRGPVVVAEKSQSTRSCELAERANGVVVNVKTGQPFTYADKCVELGPSVGGDDNARMAATKAVKEFLAATLLAP